MYCGTATKTGSGQCGTPTEGTIYVVGQAGLNNNVYYLYQGGQLHQVDPGAYQIAQGNAVLIDAACVTVWGVGEPLSSGPPTPTTPSNTLGNTTPAPASIGSLDGWINHFEQQLQPLYKPALVAGVAFAVWRSGALHTLMGRHRR